MASLASSSTDGPTATQGDPVELQEIFMCQRTKRAYFSKKREGRLPKDSLE